MKKFKSISTFHWGEGGGQHLVPPFPVAIIKEEKERVDFEEWD